VFYGSPSIDDKESCRCLCAFFVHPLLCGMVYGMVCGMWYVVYSIVYEYVNMWYGMWYVVCGMWYGICAMCGMWYVWYMWYVVCEQVYGSVCKSAERLGHGTEVGALTEVETLPELYNRCWGLNRC
jgi:hypothetical protein